MSNNTAHRALHPLLADAKRALLPELQHTPLGAAVMALIPAINEANGEHNAALDGIRERDQYLEVAYSRFDLLRHLRRQREWSEATFGPGDRRKGIIDHIRKELIEVEHAPKDVTEWIDVAILALDGAWRSGATPEQIIDALVAKQTKNEGRVWPDWRTQDENKAIEHDRSADPEGLPTDIAPPADLVEQSETMMLVFHGYSDDTFGEYLAFNDDFDDAGSGTPIEWVITAPDGDQLVVFGQYCHGSSTGWTVGVYSQEQDGTEIDIPEWPISVERSERAYSPALFVSAPVGSTIRCLQRREGDGNEQD